MRESLLPLAESVADGTDVDWDQAAREADPVDQSLIRQLRVLARLSALHRTLSGPPALPAAVAERRSQTAPAIGTWAHLTLLERLGGGTYGEVYRAWDRQLEREVALKLLRGSPVGTGASSSRTRPARDDPETSRITREGRLLARVRHRNVITVHGVDTHEGRVGLWMELLRGQTLEQLLRTRGAFGAREAALIGIDLCRALAAVHAAGLLHRDVKADNVMREDGGRIVLMDMGTGREIQSGAEGVPDLAGTPLYIAPELFDGVPASQASDVYSLGVLLYHLVTGSFPVWARSVAELKERHRNAEPIRLRDARADLPTVFVSVLDRAIAKDTSQRYQTAGALEADLLKSLDEETQQLTVTTPSKPHEGGPGLSRRNLLLLGTIAATIAIVMAVIAGPVFRTPDSTPTAAIRSIAVLPLANISGDASQEYFADGMTDELIGTLGQLPGINVISRTSAMQFKGAGQPVREIARALKVDAVLEGTVFVTDDVSAAVEKRGKRVRINERLILAGSDTQLWTRTFEHALTDVLSIQSEIANAVAADLNMTLTPQVQRAIAAAGSQVADAQDAYLEGRALLTNANAASLAKARQALERAVRIDPRYSRAHASLSVAYVWLELMGVLPREQARGLAVASARRAIELEPNLAEAHAALADVQFFYDWNWAEAGTEYRRALALNPNYAPARGAYAWYLAAQGQTAEAVRHAMLAADADPLSAEAIGALGMMLHLDRRHDDAIRQLRRAAALAPNSAQEHGGLARAYAAKRDFPRAITEMEEAVRLSGNAPLYVAGLARVHAASGHATQARALLAGAGSVDPSVLAFVYAALGDRERAFSLLDRSLQSHASGVLWARVDPRLDPIRQDPRFTRFVSRLGGAVR